MAAPTQTASAAADAFVADILDGYGQSEEEREAKRQRTEIIARAVDLISPSETDRPACCAAIWDGLDKIRLQGGHSDRDPQCVGKTGEHAATGKQRVVNKAGDTPNWRRAQNHP
jgi:hypothetical protein